MVLVTKGQFVTKILRDITEINAFYDWLNSADATAKATKIAWDSSNHVELDSPFVQGLIAALVPTVLSQSVLDRANAEIALQTVGQNISTVKRYRVEIPPGTTDPMIWVSQYATKDITVAITGNIAYVEAERGTFICPTAVEV